MCYISQVEENGPSSNTETGQENTAIQPQSAALIKESAALIKVFIS